MFLKDFLKKIILKYINHVYLQETKHHEKLPSMQRVNITYGLAISVFILFQLNRYLEDYDGEKVGVC